LPEGELACPSSATQQNGTRGAVLVLGLIGGAMCLSVRLFDTILSTRSGDSVSRNGADFWKSFCQSAIWEFHYERIHSLVDIELFFSRKIREDVIIFNGHGSKTDGFHLSNGDILNGNHTFFIPPKNHDKILIFSACSIGNNAKLSNRLKEFFKAKAVFSYRKVVYDHYCFLNESILLAYLDRVHSHGRPFNEAAFADFQQHTNFMRFFNQNHARVHPMLMF
jgi:hypothetical protein